MTAEREGVQASQGARNHTIFVITLPENARERGHVAARQTKTLRLVDFLTSKGIVNLPQSVFPDRCYSEVGNNSRTRGRMR